MSNSIKSLSQSNPVAPEGSCVGLRDLRVGLEGDGVHEGREDWGRKHRKFERGGAEEQQRIKALDSGFLGLSSQEVWGSFRSLCVLLQTVCPGGY